MIKIATIYELKPRFQALLRPLVGWLASRGVTANQVTIGATLLSIAAGAAIALQPSAAWPLALLPLVLFLRMALNAIDGMLAREHDMQTALGGMLNELGDVISDSALYLPLALVPGIDPALMVSIVLLAVCTELTGVVAVQIGAQRRYDGPMGKSDRAFVFGTLGLLLALGVRPGAWLDGLLAIVLALLILTITNRARRAIAEAR
jgi:CDP-diacylglycerol--glycerol-3-phosphate 3-phosphatidyltransferase